MIHAPQKKIFFEKKTPQLHHTPPVILHHGLDDANRIFIFISNSAVGFFQQEVIMSELKPTWTNKEGLSLRWKITADQGPGSNSATHKNT